VDMFNLSGWFHTTQRSDLAAVRKLAPTAAIYLEMTHSTGWHPYFLKPGLYGTHGDPRTSDHQFYTTALLACRRGADGLSLFNFVYYRMGGRSEIPVMEPPFHVLSKLKDIEFLSRQDRYFMLGGSSYYRQVPRELTVGQPVEFVLDMLAPGPVGAGASPPSRLRVHTEHELTPAHVITAAFNGCPLDPCPDTTGFFGNPFDGMISPPGHRRAWFLPGQLLKDGLNSLQVELAGGGPTKVIYVDAGVTPFG